MYSKSIDDASKAVDTAMSNSQKKSDDSFLWSKTEYDSLIVGDTVTGVGGTNYNTLEQKFGKPASSSESTSRDYTTKYITWVNMESENYK